jgi:threonine dehydrogenase-like Zn-dependent dehydrogenase
MCILRLIETGQLDSTSWITHRTAFEDVIDVFPSYTRPETGVIKAIIDVGNG